MKKHLIAAGGDDESTTTTSRYVGVDEAVRQVVATGERATQGAGETGRAR